MSNSGEGTKGVDDIVEKPDALAEAEARLREATEIARHERPKASGCEIAKEVVASLGRPLTALLALGVIACVTDIDKNPPPNPAAASASANPGPSGAAGAGGEPPDPDKWGKQEGALYGIPGFTLTTPADTKPAFDEIVNSYWDVDQCEVGGQPYTLFSIYTGGDTYSLGFAAGNEQNPEDAMASPGFDFVDGLEAYGEISGIACYKDKIVLDTLDGGLIMGTLIEENGGLKMTDVVQLPFSSSEITILVDNGVPYLYYKSGPNAYRTPLDGLPAADVFEAVPELTMNGSLPAEIIPPDPETGEGLYFGEKNGIVYAAKTLAGLAASNAVVKELNGNPPAYFTGNVTATPVYDEKGNLIKVYVTFVRQQTEFGKRKLHYIVYSLVPKVDPLPDTDPVPDTDKADAGSTAEPEEDASPTDDLIVVEEGVIGDADDGDIGEPGDAELPWELAEEDAPEDVPEDVPPIDPDDGAEPIDEGKPQDPGQPPDEGPKDTNPTDPGNQTTDPVPTGDPDTAKADTTNADAEPPKLDIEDPDAEKPDPNPPFKQFTFKLGPEYGNCTATVTPVGRAEANKYGINVEGSGSETKPCVAEVRIEGSNKPAMLYTFWNDVDGNVKSMCYMVDKAGVAKPFCDVLAVNNLFDFEEDGEGTEAGAWGTVTGGSGTMVRVAKREGEEGEKYVDVLNRETGIVVNTRLANGTILPPIPHGVWYRVDVEQGTQGPLFPEIPNPPEGAESLPIPWELQPETQHGDFATTQPPGVSDPTGCAAGTFRRVKATTSEKPAEKPSNPGTFLLLLSTIATVAASRFRRKERAS